MAKGESPNTSRFLGKHHADQTRAKIKSTQILLRLQENIFAEEDFLTSGQIKSAEILLRKVIPDLKAIEHSGEQTINHKPLNMEEILLRLQAIRDAQSNNSSEQ